MADNKEHSKEPVLQVRNHSSDASISNAASPDEHLDLANPVRKDAEDKVDMVDNRYSYYIYKF